MASSSSSIPTQIAETIQTASLQRNPSPRHDLNPSTAASEMEPVRLVEEDREKKQQQRKQRRRELRKKREEKRRRHESSIDGIDDDSLSDDDEDYGDDDFGDGDSSEEDDDDDDEIPISVLRPRPRERSSYPPMPDLRFEQSYLHSLAKADTWWKVAWVTVRDQVCIHPPFPFPPSSSSPPPLPPLSSLPH